MGYVFTSRVKYIRESDVRVSDAFFDRLCLFYSNHPEWSDGVSGIWSTNFSRNLTHLNDVLLSQNTFTIRHLLFNIFNESILEGVELYRVDELEFGALWRHALITAANATGALPVINTEQPVDISVDPSKLVDEIEKAIGFELNVRSPSSFITAEVEGRKVPFRTLYGIPTFCVMNSLNPDPKTICEIGGGVGMLCSLVRRKWSDVDYYMLDIPIIAVLQAYFLAVEFGEDAIWLLGENDHYNAKIHICGLNHGQVPFGLDCVVNQNSLPEIPYEAALNYVNMAHNKLAKGSYFISSNHESSTACQVRVFDLVNKVGKFKPLFRCPAWPRINYDRSNYVMEVWQKK